MLSWWIADNKRQALAMGFKQLIESALIARPNHEGVQECGDGALAKLEYQQNEIN